MGVHVLLSSLIRVIDVAKPHWLQGQVLDYLPSSGPLELVSLRAPVYLVSSSFMDRVCPPRKVCYHPTSAEEVREALNRIAEELRRLREKFSDPSQLWSILDESRRVIDRVADEAASRVKPTECTLLVAMGCYRRVQPCESLHGVEPGPAIFIDVDRLEVVAQELEVMIGANLDSHEKRWLREGLLSEVIAHEHVHSLCDAGPSDSPSRRLQDTFFGRVIEESLATYYGVKHSHLYGLGRQALRFMITAKQPLEYRVFWKWEVFSEHFVDQILLAWAGLDPSIVRSLQDARNLLYEVAYRYGGRVYSRYWYWPSRLDYLVSLLNHRLMQILAAGDSLTLWKLIALDLASNDLALT